MIPAAWEEELPLDYPERDYIIQGVREGFRITARQYEGPPVWERNYRSAEGPDNRKRVQDQIVEELENGRYIRCTEQPAIISALGAIPKPGGSAVRLIHDCSRPQGGAVNELAVAPEIRYQTLQDAAEIIGPGYFMAKVDLKSAYRSVKVHGDGHRHTGLAWQFGKDMSTEVIYDGRIPFGSRLGPAVFHTLSQAVRHILAAQGFPGVVAYLDDFLIVAETSAACQRTMTELMGLVRRLGFAINYSKVEGPTRRITFLGVEIDTESYTLRLPGEKIEDLLTEAQEFVSRRSVTKRQLQSIAGKLNWAAQVVPGGRPHLRRILDLIQPLRAPGHRCRLTKTAKLDLEWWIRFLAHFNGTTPILDSRPLMPVCLDACPVAGGGYFAGQWFHARWDQWEGVLPLHINYKEVLALVPAAHLWAPAWKDRKVIIHSDNQAAVGIINRGTSRHPLVMEALRGIFWMSAIFNFRIRAVYYPGASNTLADAASRLHESGAYERLARALAGTALY